jgi:sporulation protein YlmC with PRC-barrel domain
MARRKDRSERDRAGIGPEPHAARELVPLHELKGYDFADGEPDIRGWDVCTVNGRELGEVEDVLVDPHRGEVVMLEVELRAGGVHAEVPIRAVQLDRERKIVLLDSGDLVEGVRDDEGAPDRIGDDEREPRRDVRGEHTVRYGERADRADRDREAADRKHDQGVSAADARPDTDEVVVERRPVIEEVVVRRRVVDEE